MIIQNTVLHNTCNNITMLIVNVYDVLRVLSSIGVFLGRLLISNYIGFPVSLSYASLLSVVVVRELSCSRHLFCADVVSVIVDIHLLILERRVG